MKKVLIALDYDPTAKKVAEAGISMAKSMKAEVILLHVLADPVYYSAPEYSPVLGFTGFMEMGQLQSASIDGLKKASQLYLDSLNPKPGSRSIKTMIKEGEFADSILETAKEVNADIIVMGSHSHRWLEEILIGSVTEKVLHHTAIPLFIIPTKKTS